MAEIQISISIDDPSLEAEFVQIAVEQNAGRFIDFMGGTIEGVQTATSAQRKAFVEEVIAGQLAQTFAGSKAEKAADVARQAAQTAGKEALQPKQRK